MAQVLKLKRTAVQGKTPTTSNLELGELAINTYDGKIFFERDNGTPSIQQILTTNTSATGSIQILGDITSSNLYVQGNALIDGDLVLGGNITIGNSNTDSLTITADLSSSLIPDLNATFDLGSSSKKWNNLYVVTASADYFIGDGSGITNVVTEIAEVSTVTSSFDNTSSFSVTHNFNSKNVLVSVYGSDNTEIIPQSVTLTNNNTTDIVLSGNNSGYVVVAKGGHIVSGSTDWGSITNLPLGLVSGSNQITSLTTYKETVSDNSTYNITHNLGEQYPIVQAWNTSTSQQEVPSSITTNSTNQVTVVFSTTFAGVVIVKK